jgi:hypothetical protein
MLIVKVSPILLALVLTAETGLPASPNVQQLTTSPAEIPIVAIPLM